MIGTGRLLLAADDSELGAVEYDLAPGGRGRIRPAGTNPELAARLYALSQQEPKPRLVLVTQDDTRMEVRLDGMPDPLVPRPWWRVMGPSVG